MQTFHLLNFGCRASQADGAALKRQLLQAGLEESAGAELSQVAVLNTCTVTAAADAEVRQVIRRIHRLNPHCRILVTGCYAQRAPDEIAQLPGVQWVVGNSHKHRVAELLKASLDSRGKFETRDSKLDSEYPNFDLRNLSFGAEKSPAESTGGLVQIPNSAPADGQSIPNFALLTPAGHAEASQAHVLVGEIPHEFHFAPVFPDDRTRPTLKIQDGCNARCSFCVIPYVRGGSRSLSPEKVVEQIRDLERDGYREIVLSGINLGSYGKDLDRRLTFLGLLERILQETSMPRVRISSIEPMDVCSKLIRLAAQEPRLAQHFHVPLQSGCDRILRLMNRRYWTAQYAERVLAIRERIPNCGIGADVMVGFPGETDQDHQTSARFIASLPFTYLHIFPFSPRPRTPAAAMSGQVNGRVMRARSQEIRSLLAKKRQAFLEAQVGRSLSVLTLDKTHGGVRMALSSNYLKVVLPGHDLAPNALLDVRVAQACGGLLYGYPDL